MGRGIGVKNVGTGATKQFQGGPFFFFWWRILASSLRLINFSMCAKRHKCCAAARGGCVFIQVDKWRLQTLGQKVVTLCLSMFCCVYMSTLINSNLSYTAKVILTLHEIELSVCYLLFYQIFI